jgi:hypothetical protein
VVFACGLLRGELRENIKLGFEIWKNGENVGQGV